MQIVRNRKFLLLLISLVSICVLGICVSAIVSSFGSNSIKASKQSDYPILPDSGSLVTFIYFNSLEMLTQYSDLVIEGTVGSALPFETTTYFPPNGTAESAILNKTGQSGYQITKYAIKITINDTMKGKANKNEIVLYRSSITIDAEPQLTQGEKLMFFLHKDSSSEGYIIMAVHEGYFYIAADNKVYPSEVTKGLKSTSGMYVDKFKQDVRSYVPK